MRARRPLHHHRRQLERAVPGAGWSETLKRVTAIYDGSDGDATRGLYQELAALGPLGLIALNLFRANKNSARAKVYRGGNEKGRYRDQAYDRKQYSMTQLCAILQQYPVPEVPKWGWAKDEDQQKHCWVLYVHIPTGQVSFHTEARGEGPNYDGFWDGIRGASVERVCKWAAQLLEKANEHSSSEQSREPGSAGVLADRVDLLRVERDQPAPPGVPEPDRPREDDGRGIEARDRADERGADEPQGPASAAATS